MVVRKGQLFRKKTSGMVVEVIGRKGDAWRCVELREDGSPKRGGSHTMSRQALLRYWEPTMERRRLVIAGGVEFAEAEACAAAQPNNPPIIAIINAPADGLLAAGASGKYDVSRALEAAPTKLTTPTAVLNAA